MENKQEKILPPNETRYNDLTGVISANLNEDFNEFAATLAGYNPERFQAVAVKVYIANSPIVTIYAYDRGRESNGDNLPVHKYKFEIPFDELFTRFKEINFTLTKGDVDIERMEVINK